MPTGRLLLYLTYQPCHHSGGHSKKVLGDHGTSCTELLCSYVREVLRPQHVALEVRISYTYRAHWEVGEYDPKYEPAVLAARRGLQLLVDEGVRLEPFAAADWSWLVAHCDAPAREAWATGVIPFRAPIVEARRKLDSFVGASLRRYTSRYTCSPRPEGGQTDGGQADGAQARAAAEALSHDQSAEVASLASSRASMMPSSM